MRCPKCGYTSFDHLETCKKCGKDLVEFKQRYGIRSVLFPGQMNPEAAVAEAAYDSETADAAVAAATGAAAIAAAEAPAEQSPVAAGDSDDFGFDFMGDSAEDDDLSFDELFEEAPEDEDVEETIEGPREQPQTGAAEEGEEDDFSFELPEEDPDLDDDFGFDPVADEEAAAEDGFSFADDEPDAADETADEGHEEDPKSPFDLPESSQSEGAPEHDDQQSRTDLSRGETAQLFPAVNTAEQSEPEVAAGPIIPEGEHDGADEHGESAVFIAAAPVPADEPPPAPADEAVEARINQPVTVDEAIVGAAPVAAGNASLAKRCGAFVIDTVLLCLVGGSFIVAAEAAMATGSGRLLPSVETLIDLSVPYFLVLFSLAFGYFTLFHFLAGQTPGKMLAGLRVETTDGEALVFGHAFLRSVGGLLQLLPAGLGCLTIPLNSERRGWNDRLAGTCVVDLKTVSRRS